MVDAYGKASSVQFDSGELKLFWDDNSYNKEVKATFSKKENNYSLSNLNLINLGKIL